MAAGPRDRPGPLATVALAAWIAAVVFLQWLLFGPHLDLSRLTGLPLNFVLTDWLPFLRGLFTAPLGS